MKTETWTDPIVEEIHAIRRKMLEDANYDFDVVINRLMESQKRHGDRLVTLDMLKARDANRLETE
jgi:hypothetical protein